MTFGKWPEELHQDHEQVQRILKAQEKGLTKNIIALDLEAPKITVQGSAEEPYVADLDFCNCPDFIYRHTPCKHIYRLAFEMGLMDGLPEYDKKKGDFSPEAEIERYKKLYLEGRMPADAYVAICKAIAKL